MTIPQDQPGDEQLRWKNASSGQDTCVDVAHTLEAVRDSKNPDGPILRASRDAMLAMMRSLRD
ncbi:DUF397 domain-containing protein [Kibdelosporangium phytohabitans]|uniref:DUF397 domain-containing protein n=1 Tax=Kibdelosporangium phytohabitans TaxID=860235 RepID=A0A0N7F2V3_9PSEU|nr:DUF397 domain-containing protein [Kibdelosporangium phytohabitans]ALG06871.1 hypothetical protein AOZ06_07930 [Kibdelosporangium phytohabitans]MBE1468121.1 hypothetical protein [Kibdelosporangium phytohabitans]